MGGNSQKSGGEIRVELDEDGPVVDAELIAGLLNGPANQVIRLIRQGAITTLSEKGIDEHEGGFRLRFFHRSRRAKIEVDRSGRVFNRTVIDFGDRPLPASLRGTADRLHPSRGKQQ